MSIQRRINRILNSSVTICAFITLLVVNSILVLHNQTLFTQLLNEHQTHLETLEKTSMPSSPIELNTWLPNHPQIAVSLSEDIQPTTIKDGAIALFYNTQAEHLLTDKVQTFSLQLRIRDTHIQPVLLYQHLGISAVIVLSYFLLLVSIRRNCHQSLKPIKKLSQQCQSLPLPSTAARAGVKNDEVQIIDATIQALLKQQKEIFSAQAKEATSLREQAYCDRVTGLGNRAYFINLLKTQVNSVTQNGFALLKTDLIDKCYKERGFQQGDNLVTSLAKDLTALLNEEKGECIARLSYDEFAVYCPDIDEHKLRLLGQAILAVFEHSSEDSLQHHSHIALVINTGTSEPSQLLAQLDNALAQAKLAPDTCMAIQTHEQQQSNYGKQHWQSLVMDAIKHHDFEFTLQPALYGNNKPHHFEVFSSFRHQDKLFHASQYLGAVEALNFGCQLDKFIIQYWAKALNAQPELGPIAINLTNSSIVDPNFLVWLSEFMTQNAQLNRRVYFEIQESNFIHQTANTQLLCNAVRHHQFGFGIDNYGRYFKSLDYLDTFRPDYVKIDYAYTHQLNDYNKASLLASISRTAHSLNIMTIATRIETETQLNRLSELFVNGFQGYFCQQRQRFQDKSLDLEASE